MCVKLTIYQKKYKRKKIQHSFLQVNLPSATRESLQEGLKIYLLEIYISAAFSYLELRLFLLRYPTFLIIVK